MKNRLKTWLVSGGGKKIILLRHGELQDKTDEKRFIGQLDLPLSDRGKHQARSLRQCLSDVPLTHIISSDLSRCMETAHIIAAGRTMDIITMVGLREIHLGQWDGMSFRQVKRRWPDAYEKRGLALARFRPPAGESFLDLQQRVVPIFEQAVDRQDHFDGGPRRRQPRDSLPSIGHAAGKPLSNCPKLGSHESHRSTCRRISGSGSKPTSRLIKPTLTIDCEPTFSKPPPI
jgi:probable phosphoglycerate mutase